MARCAMAIPFPSSLLPLEAWILDDLTEEGFCIAPGPLSFFFSKGPRNLEIENKYTEWARSEASLLSTYTNPSDHQNLLLGHLHHHFLQIPQTTTTNSKTNIDSIIQPPPRPSRSISFAHQKSDLKRSHLLPYPRSRSSNPKEPLLNLSILTNLPPSLKPP